MKSEGRFIFGFMVCAVIGGECAVYVCAHLGGLHLQIVDYFDILINVSVSPSTSI